MEKIDERIQWYEQNSTNWYDELVRIELKKIHDLYDAYEDSTDEMFVHEMIEGFCKIIETQRERIHDLEAGGSSGGQSFGPQGDFQNDKQLQEAFTVYCLNHGKSSYTVNDYCSRIKNLWKSFYAEYIQDELPKELEISAEEIKQNSPLLNAYHYTEELNCYINMKIAEAEGNRNWANNRAALNKFDEFKITVSMAISEN